MENFKTDIDSNSIFVNKKYQCDVIKNDQKSLIA